MAIAAFLLNAALMAGMADILALPYLLAQAAATGIVTFLTFATHHAWTFANRRDLANG